MNRLQPCNVDTCFMPSALLFIAYCHVYTLFEYFLARQSLHLFLTFGNVFFCFANTA